MRYRSLLSYLAGVMASSQRYLPPCLVLLLAAALVLTSPPVDAGALQLVLAVLLPAGMWLGFSAVGMEDEAQRSVTAVRCGSPRRLCRATLGVAFGFLVPVPVVAGLLGAVVGSMGAAALPWWLGSVVVVAAAGVLAGGLLHDGVTRRGGHGAMLVVGCAVLAVPGARWLAGRLPGGPVATAALAAGAASLLVLLCVGVAAGLRRHAGRG